MTALEDALRAADAVADTFLDGKHIPGVAYGVVVGGELIHSRGIGTLRVGEDVTPDADSVFRIASMTKSFTAATILSLRDEGRLALDDPIRRYVPELGRPAPPDARLAATSVRQLLTMSSGLATDDPWGDRQQGLDLGRFAELLQGGPDLRLGARDAFEYSNLGYGILGRLITNVAGAEYRDVVRERLLRAAGHGRDDVSRGRGAAGAPRPRLPVARRCATSEEPLDPYGAFASMGGIFTSVRDLARWVAFFTDAFPPRDDPEGDAPLREPARREMQQVHDPWPIELEPARARAARGRDRRRLRLRPLRHRRHALGPLHGSRRRLPGLRHQHALADRIRPGRHRPRQPPLRAVGAPGPRHHGLAPGLECRAAHARSARRRRPPPRGRPWSASRPPGTTPLPPACSP